MITITINVDGQEAQTVHMPPKSATPPGAMPAWINVPPFELTDRELDVVRMAAAGMQYKQIADSMGVAESTVRTHMHNAFARLGLQGGTMLVTWAWLTGLIDGEDVRRAWLQIAPHLVRA